MFFPSTRRNESRSVGSSIRGRGGRSKVELSAQEELAKAREERERRKRVKLENQSAVVIQANWRGWSSRCLTYQLLRNAWSQRFGTYGAHLEARNCFALGPESALGSLLFFYDPEVDHQRLAGVARIFASHNKTAEFASLLASYNAPETRSQLLYRLKAVALECLRTLTQHRHALAPVLAAARPAAPLDPGAGEAGALAGPLLECVLLLVSPDPYVPVLGKPLATSLASAVLTALADSGMCGHLYSLLSATLLPPPNGATSPVVRLASKPYVEALVTQLTVRLLALRAWTASSPDQSLHSLLFVPGLWQRCGSLQPVAPRVTRQALGWLAAAGPARLAGVLPGGEGAGGARARAVAVAALIGNILNVGPRLLQPDKAAAGAAAHGSTPSLRGAALSTARVLHAAVSLVPLSPFLPDAAAAAGLVSGGGGVGVADEDEDEVDESACVSLGLQRLPPLPPSAAASLPPMMVEHVQGLTGAPGRQLLKQLIGLLLPQSALDAPAAPTAPPPSTSSLLEAAECCHALCELVWTLAGLPGQRQRVLLGLAVGSDFVERMWWSFLRPARAADLAGIAWLPEAEPAGQSGSPASGSLTHGSAAPTATPMDVDALPAAASPMLCSRSSSLGATQADGEGALTGPGGGAGAGGGWRPRLAEELGWLLPLAVTCATFFAHVTTSTLEEFYGSDEGGEGSGRQRPLALAQLYDPVAPEAGLLAMLRDGLWHVLWSDGESEHSGPGDALYAALARSGGQLYGTLYERNSRRTFCPTEAFHATALAPERFFTEASTSRGGGEVGSARVWQVLLHAPYLVPFADRARLFQGMVAREREEYRSHEEHRFLESGMLDAGLGNRFYPIRRDQLLFDGFDRLHDLGERLKGRVRITFIDAHGNPEAGVDGGGLFKDFLEELMRSALSPAYGLFAANPSHQLYPSPAAPRACEDAPRLLTFLGAMAGKALWEGVLLELPLAGFFLKKFRGASCDLNDLPTLDPQLYTNLLRLRDHLTAAAAASPGGPDAGGADGGSPTHGSAADPDALDLGLTFTVADDAAAALGCVGEGAEVELKPGGRHIAVTPDNVREYMHRVAHYKLNISPRAAVSAFLSGFYSLIPRDWVAMFSGAELQTLISGSEGRLDLDDMRAHTEYAGGYHEDHPVVHVFWEALAGFSPEEQRGLLKFVTACSRAPLLGFKYLQPRLCVALSGSMLDPAAPGRLPTASTCMNLLKLPPYRTVGAMREKLLYAVRAGAGFDLS